MNDFKITKQLFTHDCCIHINHKGVSVEIVVKEGEFVFSVATDHLVQLIQLIQNRNLDITYLDGCQKKQFPGPYCGELVKMLRDLREMIKEEID